MYVAQLLVEFYVLGENLFVKEQRSTLQTVNISVDTFSTRFSLFIKKCY